MVGRQKVSIELLEKANNVLDNLKEGSLEYKELSNALISVKHFCGSAITSQKSFKILNKYTK